MAETSPRICELTVFSYQVEEGVLASHSQGSYNICTVKAVSAGSNKSAIE